MKNIVGCDIIVNNLILLHKEIKEDLVIFYILINKTEGIQKYSSMGKIRTQLYTRD